jgi:hypothetical protein
VGDQATFALSVIAYRAGVTGFELPVPDETHIRAIPGDEEMLFSINSQIPRTRTSTCSAACPAASCMGSGRIERRR